MKKYIHKETGVELVDFRIMNGHEALGVPGLKHKYFVVGINKNGGEFLECAAYGNPEQDKILIQNIIKKNYRVVESKKTLKVLIDEYFEQHVQVSESGYHCYDSFLRTHERLSQSLEDYDVSDIFPEWYDYVPECWEPYLIPAIHAYINNFLEPKYHQWAVRN